MLSVSFGQLLVAAFHLQATFAMEMWPPVDLVMFQKMATYYLRDPNTALDRTIFGNMKRDVSIDFVIDISNSPSSDEVNQRIANSPINSVFFGVEGPVDASMAYYSAVGLFIDWVTLDMNPSQVYTTLIDNGRKFYIRGRPINITYPTSETITLADAATNLRTLWPHMTGSDEPWHFSGLFQNNLGHLTKLALFARDNGLPIVLKDRKDLKTGFTIVITDGSSNAPSYLYSSDPNKTMIIDIGGRRYSRRYSSIFSRRLALADILQYCNVVSIDTPQALPLMVNTARFTAASALAVY